MFLVPIHPETQKYLKFSFNKLYSFTCVPSGYGQAMRILTKLTKVPEGTNFHICRVQINFPELYLEKLCDNNLLV